MPALGRTGNHRGLPLRISGGHEMIVLSPEGKAQTSAAKVASLPQFTELRGKVLGLLDNSKPNADKLAERFAELLKERYGVAKVISAAQAHGPAGSAQRISRRTGGAGRFRYQRPRRLRIVHVVECPRLNRDSKARPVCDHVDHPRLRRVGEIREGSLRRAGSSGAGRAASDRHGEDRRSEQESRRGVR